VRRDSGGEVPLKGRLWLCGLIDALARWVLLRPA